MTEVTAAKIAGLRAIPYLAALPAADLARLAALSTSRVVRRGATIFEEGVPATGLFVVLEGRVRLVRASAAGRQQVLHAEGPGATLAEVPVFDGGGYVASAVAEDDARLLFVPRAPVLALCRRPDVALGVILVLAGRLRRFAGLIEDLALRDVTARLARLLLATAARPDGWLDLPGTRDDVAARLGTVRELVSRSLARLAGDGAIERRGARVRVRDAARLRAAAERAPRARRRIPPNAPSG